MDQLKTVVIAFFYHMKLQHITIYPSVSLRSMWNAKIWNSSYFSKYFGLIGVNVKVFPGLV